MCCGQCPISVRFLHAALKWRKNNAPDGVSGGELGERNVAGGLVGDERVLGRLLPVVGGGELCEIAVVVSLHLVVEDLGLAGVRARDEVFVQHAEDVVTYVP